MLFRSAARPRAFVPYISRCSKVVQSPREWATQTLGELGELGVHPGVCVRGPLPTTSFVDFFSAGAIVIDGICTPLCRRSQAGSFARQPNIIRQRLGFHRVGTRIILACGAVVCCGERGTRTVRAPGGCVIEDHLRRNEGGKCMRTDEAIGEGLARPRDEMASCIRATTFFSHPSASRLTQAAGCLRPPERECQLRTVRSLSRPEPHHQPACVTRPSTTLASRLVRSPDFSGSLPPTATPRVGPRPAVMPSPQVRGPVPAFSKRRPVSRWSGRRLTSPWVPAPCPTRSPTTHTATAIRTDSRRAHPRPRRRAPRARAARRSSPRRAPCRRSARSGRASSRSASGPRSGCRDPRSSRPRRAAWTTSRRAAQRWATANRVRDGPATQTVAPSSRSSLRQSCVVRRVTRPVSHAGSQAHPPPRCSPCRRGWQRRAR